MENLKQIAQRVETYVRPRMKRWGKLIETLATDPRHRKGRRHPFTHLVIALLAGLIAGRKSLRDVEQLSAELGLGRTGSGFSDGALSHLLELCDERDFDALLVRTVKDMARRGELRHPGLNRSWVAIDGKYVTLDHHGGGLAQKFDTDTALYWRLGFLRAVMVSAPSRPALGQWAMGPAQSEETNPEKLKHTGEITNLPTFVQWLREQYGDQVSNFTLDAGLWSKQLFLSMDQQGLGVMCGLKNNKPDLFAEAERVLSIARQRRSHQAQTDWEPYRDGKIRRRLWRTTTLDGWNDWRHLRQVLVVEQTTLNGDGEETVELRYFVTNATTGMLSPRQLLMLVRQHWGIENDCNWTFDVQLGEDDKAWCTKNKATLVLGVLRMIAYNLLQHLRKVHVVVQRPRAGPVSRPWRNLFEQVHRCLLRSGNDFVRLFLPTPRERPPPHGPPEAALAA